MAIDRGATPPQDPTPPRDSGAEWRWRNYAEHLSDLGYDLGDGSAADDDPLDRAVSDYLKRRRSDR
jgi:hypothetical protein